ncbi:MAG: hypothetical protein AB7T22_07665 [Calditrichaceae bacterium]
MNLFRYFLRFSVLTVFLVLACSESDNGPTGDDPDGAKALVDQANEALGTVLYNLINSDGVSGPDEINFTEPFGLYNEAYAKDNSNLDANFGLGLCGILMMTQDQLLIDAFEDWSVYLGENSPFEAPLAKKSKSDVKIGFPTGIEYFNIPVQSFAKTMVGTQKMALADAPKLSTIQNILKSKMLPVLNFAITALDRIDDNPDYVFKITPKMQGDMLEDTLEVDLTEIYALEVSLNVLKAMVDMAISYNVDFSSYDSLGVKETFSQGSTFLTVRDGGVYLSDAKSSVLSAVDKLEDGINFLRTESDPQGNDIIKIGPDDVTAADLDSILAHTDDVRDIFTADMTFSDDWDDDFSTPDENLTFNFGKFFDNPVNDFKSKLPAYTVSVGRDTVDWDYFWSEYLTSALTANIDVPGPGGYQYYHSYSWDKWGYEYNYFTADMEVPSFDEAFSAKIDELVNINNIESFYVYIYFYQYFNEAGQYQIITDIEWYYSQETPSQAIYVPIITWNASAFSEWILPDATFNGILPGMTDSEFKRIIGLTADDWEKTIRLY